MTFAFLEPQSGVEYAYNLPWLTNDKISADKLSRRLAAPLSQGNDSTAFLSESGCHAEWTEIVNQQELPTF